MPDFVITRDQLGHRKIQGRVRRLIQPVDLGDANRADRSTVFSNRTETGVPREAGGDEVGVVGAVGGSTGAA